MKCILHLLKVFCLNFKAFCSELIVFSGTLKATEGRLNLKKAIVLLGAVGVLSLLSACAISPKTYVYALQGFGSQAVPAKIKIDSRHTYGVGPLFLPEALRQPGVVSLKVGQQVRLSLFNIWGGNLQDGMTRVIASNMSEVTGVDAIWPFPWDNRNRPTRQIRIVIEQFAGHLGGQVVLKAKWALTELNGEKTLIQKRVHFAVQAKDEGFGSYVNALNELVNLLSVEMATQIAQLK